MTNFAIIGVGGKQHRVQAGDIITTEKVTEAVGETIKIQHVFLVGHGDDVKIGDPLVTGAHAEAKVLEAGRADKIRVYKQKKRKRYRVERGHRQPFIKLEITKIHA